MTSPTESMALALTANPDMTDAQVIAESLKQMNHAIDDQNNAVEGAFKAAVALGYHADNAKGAMPKADFTPWLEKHFGEKSKRPQSVQWIYKCMQAARAYALLPKAARKREAILAEFGTVKKLAGVLGALENGDNPLELAPPAPKAKRGAPTKAERAAKAAKAAKQAKAEEPADNGEGANELAARVKALDRREKVLNAKEERLNKLEESLNERERLLVIREAALPAGVTDATAKAPSADAGEVSLEKARIAARNKAAPKAPGAAATAAKPKGNGKGAGKGSKGSKADLKARAEEAAKEAIDNINNAKAAPVIDAKGAATPEAGAEDQPGGAY